MHCGEKDGRTLICYAGSASEASIGSKPLGSELRLFIYAEIVKSQRNSQLNMRPNRNSMRSSDARSVIPGIEKTRKSYGQSPETGTKKIKEPGRTRSSFADRDTPNSVVDMVCCSSFVDLFRWGSA
jgi:hypothetical protein